MKSGWSTQPIEIEVDMFQILSQFGDEVIIDYLKKHGYQIGYPETETPEDDVPQGTFV